MLGSGSANMGRVWKMNATDPIVCYTFFTDGIRRPVFEDSLGQYVIGDDGEPIRGLWYTPRKPICRW